MDTQITELSHYKNEVKPSYGATKTLAYYTLTTECEGAVNRYEVVAEVKGIDAADPYLAMHSCKFINCNEHTLTQDSITDLLNW